MMNQWFSNKNLDDYLKKALEAMTPEQLQDAFYTDLSFGTGGMRGIVGPGTNRMNIYTLRRANVGYGRFIIKRSNSPSVVIAYDSRNYSDEFAKDSAAVLATMGIKVYLFPKIAPTPQLSFAVRHLQTNGGIVITASHNPPEYNGYKIYDQNGCQLVPELVDEVIAEINQAPNMFEIVVEDYDTLVSNGKIVFVDDAVDETYIDLVKTVAVFPQLEKIIDVVYTPLHGTGGYLANQLLQQMGYRYQMVAEQMVPDPNFTTVASPNPEDPRAFALALTYAKKNQADFALATDPDGDRLGIAVLHQGDYRFLNGNQTGAILIDYLCKYRHFDGVLFNTIVTSSLGAEIAKAHNLEVVSTLTGFKFIGEQAALLEKANKRFFFGYEESYGYVVKDFVRDKDALQALVLICDVINFYKHQNKTLIDVLNEIYETYGYYQDALVNINLSGEAGAKRIEAILEHFRHHCLDEFDVVVKEDYLLRKRYVVDKIETIQLPKSNVLKYFLGDGSWFVLRPSGTEPKMKVYVSTKARNCKEAHMREEDIKQKILKRIESIS